MLACWVVRQLSVGEALAVMRCARSRPGLALWGDAYFFSLVHTALRSFSAFGEHSWNGRRRSSLSAGVLMAGSSNSSLSMNFSAPATALLYLAKLEAAAMFSGCIIQLMNTCASATLLAPLGMAKLSIKAATPSFG